MHTHDDRYYTESEIDNKLSGKAPSSHASTNTNYGAGNASNYGHVKLSDTYSSNVGGASSSIAASQSAVYNTYLRTTISTTTRPTAVSGVDFAEMGFRKIGLMAHIGGRIIFTTDFTISGWTKIGTLPNTLKPAFYFYIIGFSDILDGYHKIMMSVDPNGDVTIISMNDDTLTIPNGTRIWLSNAFYPCAT